MKPELAILIKARAKIADPANWGKGRRGETRPRHTCCASEALTTALGGTYIPRAFEALHEAIGSDVGIPAWNDAPERTHAQVLAAFDKAIASAS